MHIEEHTGDRTPLRPLFELADDSPLQLDASLQEGRVLVAREGDEIVGHLQLVPTDEPGGVEIKNMAVVPARQHTGVGRALVERAVAVGRQDGATRVLVATATADIGNLRFYQRLGFRMLTVEPDAFTPARGYPADLEADGIPVLDRIWLDRPTRSVPEPPAAPPGSDRDLIASATARLSIPRGEVPARLGSFALHAPLELLARAALLPVLGSNDRPRARARITALAEGFEQAGPRWVVPATDVVTTGPLDTARALRELADVVAERDAVGTDDAARRLDGRVSPDVLARALAPSVLPALAAAGHGNIYFALLARATLVHPSVTTIRSVLHSLVVDDARPIPAVAMQVAHDDDAARHLVEVLQHAEAFGPPASTFIAPLVEHGIAHGITEPLLRDGMFTAPTRPPAQLLRYAAFAMLQGDEEHAPYGWTHCLTLAQGALRVGELTGRPLLGTYVAMIYLLAHWRAYGTGTVDFAHVPAPSGLTLRDAMTSSPRDAAAAAWHASSHEDTVRVLASAAATNHDAHRVKYTLACFDAAAADPGAAPLYLAAAAHLNAWWELRGDPDDPWR